MGDNQEVNHGAAFIYSYGYLGVFSLLMLGIVGLPLPDEWLLSFTGYLIYKGHFQPVPALAAAVLGSVCGISVSYWLGRSVGVFSVHRYGHWFHITEERISRVHAWFGRTGRWSLLVGYFIPGVRHLAGFVAGTSKMRFREFALFAYTGAFAWSVSFVTIGYIFGKEWGSTTRTIHRDIVIGAVLAAILVLVSLFIIKKPRSSGH